MKKQIKTTLMLLTIITLFSCNDSDDGLNNSSQLFLDKLNGQYFELKNDSNDSYDYDDYYIFGNGNIIFEGIYIDNDYDCIDESDQYTADGKYIEKFYGGEEINEIYLNITSQTENKLIIQFYYLDTDRNYPNNAIYQMEFEYNNDRIYYTYKTLNRTSGDVIYSNEYILEKSSIKSIEKDYCQ